MQARKREAILLGKIWMRNSVSPIHEYEHASEVERHALEIAKEFKGVNVDLLKIAVWWHDCFKAGRRKPRIYEAIFEGRESAKIVKEQLGKILPPRDLKQIVEAIEVHNNPYTFLLTKRSRGPITQILMEADSIDDLRESRIQMQRRSERNLLYRFGAYIGNRGTVFMLWLNARSGYTNRVLKEGFKTKLSEE